MIPPPPLSRCMGKQMVKDAARALASDAGQVNQPHMVPQFPRIRRRIVFRLYTQDGA
jgi:hypothetical protein